MGVLTFFKGLESSFHFASPFTLSQFERPHSQGERGMGSFGHFQFPHVLSQYKSIYLSLKGREGWDGSVTFCSFAALRVTAGGRNP